jgi:hypothetical protein
MAELPSKPSAQSKPSIEFMISSFLKAYKSGLRNPDTTVQNLSSLYETVGERDQQRFYELLWNAYEREPFSGAAAGNYTISIPSVILRAIILFGPVADFIPRMLDHLLTLKPEGMEGWANVVSPVFSFNLLHSAGRFDVTTLDLIEGFRGRLSTIGGKGQAFPLQLIEAANNLERVIADIKLQKLEDTTRALQAGGSDMPVNTGVRMKDVLDLAAQEREAWLEIKREYGISKSMLGKRIAFVKDEFKRNVIFRDVRQAYLLANSGYDKPAVILAGGVIEELLRLYLEYKRVTPENNNLDSYIKACETNGFVRGAIHKLADSVRQFRNIVHLEKETSSKQTLSKAAAKSAVSSVFIIVNELGQGQAQTFSGLRVSRAAP